MAIEYKVDIDRQEDEGTEHGYWLTVHEIQTPPAFRRPKKEIIERKFYPAPGDIVKNTGRQKFWNTVRGAGYGILGSFAASTTIYCSILTVSNPEPLNYLLASGAANSAFLAGFSFNEYLRALNQISKFRKIQSTVNNMYYKEEGFSLLSQPTETQPQS